MANLVLKDKLGMPWNAHWFLSCTCSNQNYLGVCLLPGREQEHHLCSEGDHLETSLFCISGHPFQVQQLRRFIAGVELLAEQSDLPCKVPVGFSWEDLLCL